MVFRDKEILFFLEICNYLKFIFDNLYKNDWIEMFIFDYDRVIEI